MSRLLAVLVALPFLAGGVTAALTADRGEVVMTFSDPEIVESSGLVVRGGLLSTINDSGDTGRVFTVALDGAEAGGTVGVTRFAESPVDMEALAPAGPGEVWVGDIGDNGAARSSISVTRVPVGRGERSGTYPTYDLVYADGPRDAETSSTRRPGAWTRTARTSCARSPTRSRSPPTARSGPTGSTSWSAATRGRSSTPGPRCGPSATCRCRTRTRARASR